ncbi:exostosin family protein [Nitzschia inconspicua]|uniref:Exostosin family protein n=1 Tax=Nitzschia inconspicua TaxID=303405 RepID=A0A9K3M0Z2_9STRA|nr:exostosin family protein [Nitzschia inconspicua]
MSSYPLRQRQVPTIPTTPTIGRSNAGSGRKRSIIPHRILLFGGWLSLVVTGCCGISMVLLLWKTTNNNSAIVTIPPPVNQLKTFSLSRSKANMTTAGTGTAAAASKTATTILLPSGIQRPHSINGWEQLIPSHGGTVYGEMDSFLYGKSCHWQHAGLWGTILSKVFFFARYSFAGRWECRDCGTETKHTTWKDCPLIRRRGKCYPFRFQGFDEYPRPTRVSSTYDHTSAQPYPIHKLTSYGVGKVQTLEYHHPQCYRLTRPCFDMDRCTVAVNSTHRTLQDPLLVYAYPGIASNDLNQIFLLRNNTTISSSKASRNNGHGQTTRMVQTDDPTKACLLIVHVHDLDSAKASVSSSSWNNGRNHYVYGITKPIERGVYYDMAALGSVVMTNAHIRLGYDIPLPLPALWSPPPPPSSSSETTPSLRNDGIHRPRRWLLSFKGSIQDTLQPYYQHRWLAAEYWDEKEPNVTIDVQCKHKGLRGELTTTQPYDDLSSNHFDNVMMDTTFAFCPGGSHASSFRFTEVLSTGSIPVIMPEVVPPFSPELDWSRCVIRVSQARIVDLPRLLRSIPREEVISRQNECQRLFRRLVVCPTNDLQHNNPHGTCNTKTAYGFLETALSVWQLRIQKQHIENQLDRDWFSFAFQWRDFS